MWSFDALHWQRLGVSLATVLARRFVNRVCYRKRLSVDTPRMERLVLCASVGQKRDPVHPGRGAPTVAGVR